MFYDILLCFIVYIILCIVCVYIYIYKFIFNLFNHKIRVVYFLSSLTFANTLDLGGG
jgi:hypothetical protein